MSGVDLSGRVALVTGSGSGLGRAYALQLAKLGASVLINDPAAPAGVSAADTVVAEIEAAGGRAAANRDLVTRDAASGEAIVHAAVQAFGRLDIVVNNAGVLKDVTFGKQTSEDWAVVQEVHLWGQRNICRAAWPIMARQGYGRIVNIGSINGMRGTFGQSNYAAAKSGVLGLTKTLAMEGAKRNIKVNMVLPFGGTAMTATVMLDELVKLCKPELAAPLVAFLCSDLGDVPNGGVFEAGAGYYAEWQWRRSEGVILDIDKPITVDDIVGNWEAITDMTNATDPIEDDRHVPKQIRQVIELSEKTRSAKAKL